MGTIAETWMERGRLEGLKTGEKKGRAESPINLLEHRFRSLPSAIRERIDAAGPEQLNAWFDADSPAAVFGTEVMD